jgi:hypothetical protein
LFGRVSAHHACEDDVRCGSFICSLEYLTHSTNPELSFSRKTSPPASLILSLNIGLYGIVPPPPSLENNILEDWWLWLATGFLWPLLKSDHLGDFNSNQISLNFFFKIPAYGKYHNFILL